MQFPIIKKKCFEVKLILNKKDEFKLIHQKLVIRICFSNSPIHKEHSFQFTSLHRKLPYTENLSYNILSQNSEVGGFLVFLICTLLHRTLDLWLK